MAQRLSRHWTLVLLSLVMAGLMVGLMASTSQTTMGDEPDQALAFSGRAKVVDAKVLGMDVDLVEAGPLPAAGGSDEENLAQANIPGLLTAEALHAETVGAGSQSRSEASVSNLKLIVGGHIVEASVLKAVATATCPGPKVTGESEIVGLKVNGKEIAVPPEPNSRIDLNPVLGSYVILNEQKSNVTGNFAEITVNALHLVVPHMADVIISSAYADIKCKEVPPPPPPPDGKLEAKLDKLEGKADKIEGKLDKGGPKIEAKLDKLEGKADRLEGKADKIEGKLDKRDDGKLEAKLDKLEGKVDYMGEELRRIEAKLDKLLADDDDDDDDHDDDHDDKDKPKK